jgi:hypothetical protein
MKKHLLTLAAIAVAGVTLSACAPERTALDLPPGKYENTTESTNRYGTKTERNSSTEVYVDKYGNKKAVIESETTRDPKGLFNKTTTSKTKTVVE